MDHLIEHKLQSVAPPLAVVLPGGKRVGPDQAQVILRLHDYAALARVAGGQIGRLAEDFVEGRVEIEGAMRDVMAAAVRMLDESPVGASAPVGPVGWWREITRYSRSQARHTPESDARQIQFHYDVSDDFYALWLDPRRVYSCAYYRAPQMSLGEAQEAKLDHICRKLMLQPGERFLDIGAGWGGLLLWAAEHYGVEATGITLSKNQHAYVTQQIESRKLAGRVRMLLLDYRALDEDERYDKIASVGMFEHVGRAQLPTYFGKLLRLLEPGGLLMNHGITAGGTRNAHLGAGMGDFIERYIFPGGELLHVSHVLEVLAESGLEMVDVENLRPHYARTLWAWSDALESQLERAAAITEPRVLRAYRLYLAGCAMCFEQAWLSLHQVLATRPDGRLGEEPLRGRQSLYPFNREYMYR